MAREGAELWGGVEEGSAVSAAKSVGGQKELLSGPGLITVDSHASFRYKTHLD